MLILDILGEVKFSYSGQFCQLAAENRNKESMVTGIRLAGHQLAEPQFDSPADLVGWMGAVQAQDYAMAKWAVGVRLKGAMLSRINEALASGEIVRTHVMRPTWHFVAGKDLRWMQKLTGPRVKKAIDSWVKSGGLEVSEKQYTVCNDLLGKILSGGRCLTREEIEMEMEQAGVPIADERVRRYILRAEVEGIVCSGADKDGKPTYALLDEQVAPVSELVKEEALARLADAYFRSHSPATLNDFVWWSGLTVREAREAVGLISEQLVTERFETGEFLVHVSCRQAGNDAVVHLLPAYDEYLISYKERTTVMAAEHCPKAFNNWGIFYPVVLSQGRIVGNWKKTVRKSEVALSVSVFDSSGVIPEDALQNAEKRYRNFLKS